MTSAPTMLQRGAARVFSALAVCAILSSLTGCYSLHRHLETPATLTAPYKAPGERLWAVAPLRNESGVGVIDPLTVSDRLVSQLSEVNGISALPMNRTLAAMRALNLGSIDTPAQAMALARTLKADAVVVGSITAWNPYQPLQIGLNLGVFSDSKTMLPDRDESVTAEELLEFRKARTDSPAAYGPAPGPLSAVSVMLDADNHAVLTDVKRYATGRVDRDSAMGWEVFTKSMARFTDFACFRSTELLLLAEAQRLAAPPEADKKTPSR